MTGIAYDQVSLSHDSDIYSLNNVNRLRRRISDWIPAPPTVMDVPDLSENFFSSSESITHGEVLSVPIPNTERGSLRSASIFDAEILGLRLTKENTDTVLRFIRGPKEDEKKSKEAARQLMNFLSRWDEFIALPETDLDFLEDTWTGDINAENRASMASRSTTFYVLVEFATFIKNSWNITKEITYLAVSQAALEMILTAANFKRPPPGTKTIPDKARPCNHAVWRAAIECLRLGSPWQHFSAAVSCVRLSLYSLPERKRADHNPKVEAFGFGCIPRPRLRDAIEKIQLGPKFRSFPFGTPVEVMASSLAQTPARNIIPKPEELTFIRILKRTQLTSPQQEHVVQLCERCNHVSKKFLEDLTFSRTDALAISEYGFALVGALGLASEPPYKHDLCMFAFDVITGIDDDSALAVVVEDLLQSGKMFNTIRHPLTRKFETYRVYDRDTIWNLPLSYRPVTKKQRLDVSNWVCELHGQQILEQTEDTPRVDYWNSLQLLLHQLGHGSTWEDSCAIVTTLLKDSPSRRNFYDKLRWDDTKKELERKRSYGPKVNVDIFGNSYADYMVGGVAQLRARGSGLP